MRGRYMDRLLGRHLMSDKAGGKIVRRGREPDLLIPFYWYACGFGECGCDLETRE
jgi:hypothetical protein